MFDLPDAKRVRRAELDAADDFNWSDGVDQGCDADLRAKLNAQIAKTLGWDTSYAQLENSAKTTDDTPDQPSSVDQNETQTGAERADADEDAGQEEFEFRLFSSTKPAPKVVLEDDTMPKGDGGLVIPHRPLSYYLITDLTTKQKAQYRFAAVSGDDVLARSIRRSWGLELPWKVKTVSMTRKRGPADATSAPCGEENQEAKRRRPGKKRRVVLRRKAKVQQELEASKAKQMMEKEEHIKDKKKRLNRLKKLRKRAKGKEKKLAVEEGHADAAESDSDPDDAE